jgi:hypothetical protein
VGGSDATGGSGGDTSAGGQSTAGGAAGDSSVGAGGSTDTGGAGGDSGVGAGGDTSGGSAGSGQAGAASSCPPAPAGVSADAAAAYTLENQVRALVGSPCATMVIALDKSAQNHCDYYTGNSGSSMCTASAHVEVSGCAKFTGANFWDRETAAGYTGSAAFEDMAFQGNGAGAVQEWIDTVWHRTPILSPWVMDIGYGGDPGCDTMDFGAGASTPDSLVVTYPYAGQSGVPTSFDGTFEGPMPPAPPSGWPSGYPITVFLRGGSVSTHVLTVDGDSTPIAHQFIASGAPAANGLLPDEYVLYANTPLTSGTTYRVTVTGTNSGGAVALDFKFTTE